MIKPGKVAGLDLLKEALAFPKLDEKSKKLLRGVLFALRDHDAGYLASLLEDRALPKLVRSVLADLFYMALMGGQVFPPGSPTNVETEGRRLLMALFVRGRMEHGCPKVEVAVKEAAGFFKKSDKTIWNAWTECGEHEWLNPWDDWTEREYQDLLSDPDYCN